MEDGRIRQDPIATDKNDEPVRLLDKETMNTPARGADANFSIDCHACKLVGGMAKDEVNVFSGIILFIAVVLLIPSALGVFFGYTVISQGGVAGITTGGAIIAVSLASGLVSWLLLMRKKVFKCVRCGFILNRA